MFVIILIHNIFNRWNNRQKKIERNVLTQGMPSPPTITAIEPLHTAQTLLQKPLPTPTTPHSFHTPTQTISTHNPTSSSTQPFYNSPKTINIPKTTLYYIQKRKREESTTQKRNYKRTTQFNKCSHCNLPKTKNFGHSRHIGQNAVDTFCPSLEGKLYVSTAAWLAARKAVNPPKEKLQKK